MSISKCSFQDQADKKAAFVDFFDNNGVEWWKKRLKLLRGEIAFDGLHLVDNEPYSPWTNYRPSENRTFNLQCPQDSVEEKPEIIPGTTVKKSLAIFLHVFRSSNSLFTAAFPYWNDSMWSDETICMMAEHRFGNSSFSHYDVHNLYGLAQSIHTKKYYGKPNKSCGLSSVKFFSYEISVTLQSQSTLRSDWRPKS